MQEQIFILSPLKIVANLTKAIASDSVTRQQDCLYMKSVLVSTGQNKNDDVFIPEEMWKAKSSPEKKPVNWEHNTGYEIIDSKDGKRVVADNQIIGVMDSSYPAHKDGTPINTESATAEGFEIPRDFDIITEAVIWKYLFPRTAAKLVSEASANRIFVSMEAWFNKFDYRVGAKIVARNEQTAFLDRHLKSNGGDGIFEGQQVGRVLRDIVFGGVGIVANPANEDSVIHSFTNADLKDANATDSAVASNIIGQLDLKFLKEFREVCDNMANANEPNTSANSQVSITSDDYKEVVQRLVKAEYSIETKNIELAEAKARVSELEKNAKGIESAFSKAADSLAGVLGDVSAAKISKSGAEDFFKVLVGEINDKLSKNDVVSAELKDAKAKLEKLANEQRLIVRSNKIRDSLGLDAKDTGKIENLVASTDGLNDDSFNTWLESTKELVLSAKDAAKDKKMKEEEEEEEVKNKKKNPFAKSNKDEITDVNILNHVKAEASAPAGTDDAVKPISLPERMQTLANALWSSKQDISKGGK